MNLEVVAQREHNKQSKETNKEYQQALKNMRKAALTTIFLNNKKFSLRKSNPIRSSSTKQVSSDPIFFSLTISMGSTSPEPIKRHQKHARILNKPIQHAKETASVIRTFRSKRTIKSF